VAAVGLATVTAAVFAGVGLAVVPIDGGPLAVSPVTINAESGDQYDPHVSGDVAAYTDEQSIRYYDFVYGHGQVPPVAGASDLLSDVSNGKIVFSRVEAGGRVPVLVYDIASNTTTEIDPTPAPIRLGAAIGGNTVAFIDQLAGSGGELFVSELGGATQQVTTDLRADQSPSIAPSGDRVVFESCSGTCDIHQAVKSGGSWVASALTANSDPEANPESDGTVVVYDSTRSGERDIYWQPVGGGTEQHVELAAGSEERNPSISDGVVSFESVAVGDSTADLYVYRIATNELFRITNTMGVDESLNDITALGGDTFRVVWASGAQPERNVFGATFTLPPPPPPLTYTFGGFLQPVDPLPMLNSMKAGAAVPVKFSLGGNFGLDIFQPGYPKSDVMACDSTALVDGVEETMTAGGSSLAYDATSNTYSYVWKTEKAWAGTCRQLVLKLADGSAQRANFRFK
jgi:hypothetical protein